MAIKDDKLVIRITPGLKKRIESTAKKQGKTVSDFVRDIVSLFLNKEEPEYKEAVFELNILLEKKEQLQADIYFLDKRDKGETTLQDIENIDKLLKELTYTDQKIYTLERTINDFLNSKN